MYNIFSKKIRLMKQINGIYAATLSILNENLSLNVKKTIKHAENLINNGCHGVVFFWEHRSSSTYTYKRKN